MKDFILIEFEIAKKRNAAAQKNISIKDPSEWLTYDKSSSSSFCNWQTLSEKRTPQHIYCT